MGVGRRVGCLPYRWSIPVVQEHCVGDEQYDLEDIWVWRGFNGLDRS